MTKPHPKVQRWENIALTALPQLAREMLDFAGELRHWAFFAPMGSGKTTFIKVLCEVLGSDDLVKSPTFALVNEYGTEDGIALFHFDFYRLNDPEEALDIGLEEYLNQLDSYAFLEWPEKLGDYLPETYFEIRIETLANGNRTFTCTRHE